MPLLPARPHAAPGPDVARGVRQGPGAGGRVPGRIADLPNPDVHISLCGLGEPLLNRNVVDYVRQARAEGFFVKMSSNGSLLDERRSAALLEAGLQQILINVGEEGDDYEEVYQLPFERTLENVVRFNEMSGDACQVTMVIVDHRGDPDHVARMTAVLVGPRHRSTRSATRS